jgi:hypothetical protein
MKFVLVVLAVVTMAIMVPGNVDAQKGFKSYTVEDEFSFKYPSNWKLEERENRFTSIDARLEYGNNDVQMTFEGMGGSDSDTASIIAGADDDRLLEAIETVLEGKNDGSVFESGLDKYTINNRTAPYAIGTFSTESLFGISLDMVVLLTAVHVGDQVVLVQYYAEENDFDKYLPKAEAVFQSLTPVTQSPTT